MSAILALAFAVTAILGAFAQLVVNHAVAVGAILNGGGAPPHHGDVAKAKVVAVTYMVVAPLVWLAGLGMALTLLVVPDLGTPWVATAFALVAVPTLLAAPHAPEFFGG